MRTKIFLNILVFCLSLTSCSNAEMKAGKSNEIIRAANCQLIYDWISYRQAPENKDFWYTQVNTYDYYALEEEKIFSKIKDGDASYATILKIRKLEYDHNLFNEPPLGTVVTQANSEQYRKKVKSITNDVFISDKDAWEMMNSLNSSCNKFTAEEYASEFAYSLVMDK